MSDDDAIWVIIYNEIPENKENEHDFIKKSLHNVPNRCKKKNR